MAQGLALTSSPQEDIPDIQPYGPQGENRVRMHPGARPPSAGNAAFNLNVRDVAHIPHVTKCEGWLSVPQTGERSAS